MSRNPRASARRGAVYHDGHREVPAHRMRAAHHAAPWLWRYGGEKHGDQVDSVAYFILGVAQGGIEEQVVH